MMSALAHTNADLWLEEIGVVPASALFKDQDGAYVDEALQVLEGVVPIMNATKADFSASQEVPESRLGKAILRYIDANSLHYSVMRT
jgi:hypothetical protein